MGGHGLTMFALEKLVPDAAWRSALNVILEQLFLLPSGDTTSGGSQLAIGLRVLTVGRELESFCKKLCTAYLHYRFVKGWRSSMLYPTQLGHSCMSRHFPHWTQTSTPWIDQTKLTRRPCVLCSRGSNGELYSRDSLE